MEESAQILEIETFIPLLLQNPDDGYSRLKRWIMIGDHHQLPPVIKNMAFQKFSNMEQSLFTRWVVYLELFALSKSELKSEWDFAKFYVMLGKTDSSYALFLLNLSECGKKKILNGFPAYFSWS